MNATNVKQKECLNSNVHNFWVRGRKWFSGCMYSEKWTTNKYQTEFRRMPVYVIPLQELNVPWKIGKWRYNVEPKMKLTAFSDIHIQSLLTLLRERKPGTGEFVHCHMMFILLLIFACENCTFKPKWVATLLRKHLSVIPDSLSTITEKIRISVKKKCLQTLKGNRYFKERLQLEKKTKYPFPNTSLVCFFLFK